MQLELDKILVANNIEESRFEVKVEEHLAVIDYFYKRGEIVFTHTGVPEPLEGQGLASKMARFVLDFARSEGLKVIPRCPFIRSYIRRHSEYTDLVSDSFGEL